MTDDQRYFWEVLITLATCTNSYHKILMPHEFLLDYFNYFNFAICSRPIDHESVIYLTLKKHVWFLFRSLQLDWYKCCFERKENVEGTDAFCLMIGYEFFLDTVVTLTFFQCFSFFLLAKIIYYMSEKIRDVGFHWIVWNTTGKIYKKMK